MSSCMHDHAGYTDPTFASKARSTWEVLRRVAPYLRPYKWMAAGTVGCALLSLGFSLTYPKLTQFVIDEVIGHRRADLLMRMIQKGVAEVRPGLGSPLI